MFWFSCKCICTTICNIFQLNATTYNFFGRNTYYICIIKPCRHSCYSSSFCWTITNREYPLFGFQIFALPFHEASLVDGSYPFCISIPRCFWSFTYCYTICNACCSTLSNNHRTLYFCSCILPITTEFSEFLAFAPLPRITRLLLLLLVTLIFDPKARISFPPVTFVLFPIATAQSAFSILVSDPPFTAPIAIELLLPLSTAYRILWRYQHLIELLFQHLLLLHYQQLHRC